MLSSKGICKGRRGFHFILQAVLHCHSANHIQLATYHEHSNARGFCQQFTENVKHCRLQKRILFALSNLQLRSTKSLALTAFAARCRKSPIVKLRHHSTGWTKLGLMVDASLPESKMRQTTKTMLTMVLSQTCTKPEDVR